jgi:hypothetical protein
MFNKGFLLKVIFGGLLGLTAATGVVYILYVKPWPPDGLHIETLSQSNNTPWADCAPIIQFYDRSVNEDDFRVYRRKLGASAFPLIRVVPPKAGKGQQITIADTPLPIGTYEYKISAYNRFGESFSDIKQITVNFPECTNVPPTSSAAVPNNPIIVDLSLINNCYVRISYRDNSTNEQGFRIYRALAPEGKNYYEPDILIATLGPHNGIPGVYDDKTKLPAGKYRYRMSAYNANGEAFSNFSEIQVDPVCNPAVKSLPTKVPAAPVLPTLQKLSTEPCTWEAAKNVFLRKGPDVGIYDRLVDVEAGKGFSIIGQSEDGRFWALEVEPGVVGYITKSEKYSRTNGSCSNIPTLTDPAPPVIEAVPTKKRDSSNNGDPAIATPCPVGAVCP